MPRSGEQVEGELSGQARINVGSAGGGSLAHRVDLSREGGGWRPVTTAADRCGGGKEPGEVGAGDTPGVPEDKDGGLEDDSEREREGHPERGLHCGRSPVGSPGVVASSEQRTRQHGPDQRHFPFDA